MENPELVIQMQADIDRLSAGIQHIETLEQLLAHRKFLMACNDTMNRLRELNDYEVGSSTEAWADSVIIHELQLHMFSGGRNRGELLDSYCEFRESEDG